MASSRTKEADRHVVSVLTVPDILDGFQTRPTRSLKQIIEKTRLNRSRVIRFLGTLESGAI